MAAIDRSYIKNSLSYEEYRQMGKDLVQQGKTSGPKQDQVLIDFTKLNDKRMDRLDKTQQLEEDVVQQIKAIKQEQYWVVLTEHWCGDAAANLPIIDKLAEQNNRIRLCILLRDDNPEIMDKYLTNGSKSIPILVIMDRDLNEIGVWGPRPLEAQQILESWKKTGSTDKSAVLEEVQRWYLQDKGVTLQREIAALLGGESFSIS